MSAPSVMDPPWRHQVDRFVHQYFQLEHHLDYPEDKYLCLEEAQDDIYERAFSEGKLDMGPPDRYRIRTLKELVSRIEFAIDDWDKYAVSDQLMSTLSALLATSLPPEAVSSQKRCFVTYNLQPLENEREPLQTERTRIQVPTITLLENRSLISAGGTTGHRTWEASLHMGQFLRLNKSLIAGKSILELGAGTGYLSILCAKHLHAAHVAASDGSDDVVTNLTDNFSLNHLQHSGKVEAMNLKWGHALAARNDVLWHRKQPIDVVLGADITYDDRAIRLLVATLHELFNLYPEVQMYISATERNAQTLKAFLDTCRQNRLLVEDLKHTVPPCSQQNSPFYNDKLVIFIYRISKHRRRNTQGRIEESWDDEAIWL